MGDASRFEVASALEDIARILRVKRQNPHRARAYERGARAIASLTEDLDRVIAQKRLVDIPGIGESLAAQIEELHRTGKSGYLEKLREGMPPGLIEMSYVTTPKRIEALHEALGIETLEALEGAARAGRIRLVKGFGAKTEEQILRAIERYHAREERTLLVDVLDESGPLVEWMESHDAVARVEIAGSVRRWKETVGAVRIVATGSDLDRVRAHFEAYPRFLRVERRGEVICGRLGSALAAELHPATDEGFARALVIATGPDAHVARLRELAGGELPSAPTEIGVYEALGLPFIPPEMRDDPAVIDAARAGERFDDLLALEDVRGMVHCHTRWSDGKHSVLEMAEEAAAMGLGYVTITDHSPTAHYAGGVPAEKLAEQWAEIDEAQSSTSVRILRGTESDILGDGALDYPDDVLRRMDVIIASIHGRMRMDREQMTLRLVAAMRQPVFKIWGHALGRLVQRRDPIDCDLPRVLDAAAESPAAIEINGDPYRLDLAPEHVRDARARGLRFTVSTDAHSRRGMHNLRFGVAMARRGGVRRGEVLNALPPDEFVEAVRPAR